MSVTIRGDRLRFEMTRRGISATELAGVSGVSLPTVTAAMAGRAVSIRSLRLIVRGMMLAPVVEGMDELLA